MLNPGIYLIGNASRGSVLSEENANSLTIVCFIRENCFTREFYAFEKSNNRFGVMYLPACQYRIQKLHSVVDKDVDFGVFTAPRRPDCLVFPARTGTLMHLTESRINLKQFCVLCVGIDEL